MNSTSAHGAAQALSQALSGARGGSFDGSGDRPRPAAIVRRLLARWLAPLVLALVALPLFAAESPVPIPAGL